MNTLLKLALGAGAAYLLYEWFGASTSAAASSSTTTSSSGTPANPTAPTPSRAAMIAAANADVSAGAVAKPGLDANGNPLLSQYQWGTLYKQVSGKTVPNTDIGTGTSPLSIDDWIAQEPGFSGLRGLRGLGSFQPWPANQTPQNPSAMTPINPSRGGPF